jgi:hypothetical protein
VHLVATRHVQTNEIGRCACLLPAFGLVDSQTKGYALSLVEIGASAGLNLLWDCYGYDYGAGRRYGMSNSPVQLTCTLHGNRFPPISPSLPQIALRVGLDLAPIKVDDVEATLWLRALIWPEQRERITLLSHALQLAQQDPPCWSPEMLSACFLPS